MNNQYNQFNSPYDDLYQDQYNNLGMNQQYDSSMKKVPYINKNDNRGGGFFSFLLAVILLAVAVAFLLYFTEVVDVKSYVIKYTDKFFGDKKEENNSEDKEPESEENEEKKENPVTEENDKISSDVKDNLTKMCSNLDADNNYFLDENNKCMNDICEMIVSNDESYYKICSTEEVGRKESQAEKEEKQVHLFLDTACSLVDSNGSYNGGAITIDNNSISCENYICKIKYKDKDYSKSCTN